MQVEKGDLGTLALSRAPSFVDRARAFYELGKPNLTFLVVVTSVLGFFMAAQTVEVVPWLRLIFLVVGTALTSMGACALNMYIERDIDPLMKRTAARPIPSGRVSPEEALAFSLFTFTWGLAQLALFCGPLVAILSLLTGLLYAFVYTPAKRWGPISTWLGAVPGAVPPVMGWASVTGDLGLGGAALFAILFAWQFPHFLALAFMLRDDYAKVGFRFLPALDPTGARAGRAMFVGCLALLAASLSPWALGLVGWLYAAGAALIGLAFAGVALKACFGCERTRALRVFLASISYLPALLGLMVLDRIVL
jgi:protoheme IX farnesyltransferase